MGKKKNGIYCAVVVSSLGFGLCHYRNLLVGQNFADTTKQVLYAICFGMFLAALLYRRIIYSFRFLYMDFVIFLIFYE